MRKELHAGKKQSRFPSRPLPMKTILAFLTAVSSLLVGTSYAQTTIASWDFQPNPLPTAIFGTTFPASGEFSADNGGTGFLTAVHSNSATGWSSPAGNGSSNSLAANTWSIGDYFQFRFSTLTFSNIAIVWSQTRNSAGPTNFSLRYSTDGTSFTSFTNYQVAAATWSSTSNNIASIFTSDLSSITAIDNQSDVYLRLVADSAPTNTTGQIRIDDITITGVPEPSTYALLALAGAGLAGYVIRRRRRG